MSIHTQIIEKDGRNEFVVIPYEKYLLVQEALEDLEDLRKFRTEKEESNHSPTKSLDDVLGEIKN